MRIEDGSVIQTTDHTFLKGVTGRLFVRRGESTYSFFKNARCRKPVAVHLIRDVDMCINTPYPSIRIVEENQALTEARV